MKNIQKNKQDILVGSSKLNAIFDKKNYMLEHMNLNRAFTHMVDKNGYNDIKKKNLLNKYKKNYEEYRYNWTNSLNVKNKSKPLSVIL